MINLGKLKYSGKCLIDDRTYFFGKATDDDVQGITDIYKQIKIDITNCTERLNPVNSDCFGKIGGMFVVMDRDEIISEIGKDENFWAVLKDENGRIAGSFWFSLKNDYYKGLKYENMEKTIYPREVAVSSEYGGKHLAKVMYYTIAKTMLNAGFTTGAADLYKVIEYETLSDRVKLDMVNKPSQRTVEAIGAEFAETLPVRKILLDRLAVVIEPQMYLFDYGKVVRNCESFFAERDIKIIWE